MSATRRPVDEPVEVSDTASPRFSADALRALKKATGRTMTELFDDAADEIDRFQTLAFFELWRRLALLGHLPDAAELWDRAGVVEVVFAKEDRDPLPAGPSTTSLTSAISGE